MKYSKGIVGSTSFCHVCGRSGAEVHHIFYGPYRSLSEKYGLKTGLCPMHHRYMKTGVHGGNRELDIRLKREGQQAFERLYGHERYMEVFGRNYL